MLLYTVQFLCSVVAAFARLARALRKAMASVLCSPPVSLPATTSPASSAPLSMRRKAHPALSVAVGDALRERDQREAREQLLIAPAVDAFAACNGGGGAAQQVEPAKKAARGARKRPSMLVIPVAPEAVEVAAGWGTVVAEKEAEVEVEGEGFWLASRRGARHAMEDAYGVIAQKLGADSQLAFYGVYDGHGGRAAVDFVSDHLGKNVVAAVLATKTEEAQGTEPSSWSTDAVTAAIRAAYLATDSELVKQGLRGGSCAATALVKDGDIYVANLGDCRAVMCRGGVATAVTSDHTAAREDERSRIENSGGYVSCGSNGVWRVQDCLAVSRAFGDADLKRWVIPEPEIRRLPLTAGCEFLVLASDGLWNKVSNQEAVDAVSRSRAGRDSTGCFKELVDMARCRGSRDDITVMVVDLKRFTI
ncbi:probable protein phosphatase 2C 74 [Triticum urartu]|uniref:protein-serine/threonine phosphatase n=1 Tax=Triticum urartu TaxID=4572 RepID=A0A8R7Q0G4_TRIUA|nr:probable protein phosphatase 2C 74 [Triticum urartu]XP_048573302.1 probable protein phosphatase 2C 74 [Triticum urartu]